VVESKKLVKFKYIKVLYYTHRMKIWLKVGVVLIIAILLVSSMYVVFYSEPKEETLDETEDSTDETDETNDEADEDEQNEDEDQEFSHTVFMEEATASWCHNCPDAAKALHEHLSESDDHHFYYVTMVDDYEKASKRLHDDYNILGFPTIFIDGGYGVVMGTTDFGSRFINKCCQEVSAAVFRDVPDLYLNVDAKWNTNKSELAVTTTIENKESDTYNGLLKVYITEINSRWSDWNGDPYHFAFLDYAINKNVKIKPDENKSFSETWKATHTNIYPENLWIVAVVFNSEPVQAYSDPPNNEHSFDAYYADAADAVRVAEGNLPPSIGISSPKKGVRYILGREGKQALIGKTVILGKIDITVNAKADAGVDKIEFIVNGLLKETKETIDAEPYEWTWDTLAFGKYTITVILYDKDGKTATDSIEVFAFILGSTSN